MENARDAVKALILANDILDSAIPICYGLGLKTRPKRFGARWGCATKRSARNNPLAAASRRCRTTRLAYPLVRLPARSRLTRREPIQRDCTTKYATRPSRQVLPKSCSGARKSRNSAKRLQRAGIVSDKLAQRAKLWCAETSTAESKKRSPICTGQSSVRVVSQTGGSCSDPVVYTSYCA
jgi:hypothetical protein